MFDPDVHEVRSQSEFQQLHREAQGLLYNDFSGRGSGGAQYNVLHAASCARLARSNTNVRKLFFQDLGEAVGWLEANRGPEGVGWKRCGSCGGRSRSAGGIRPAVAATPRPAAAVPGQAGEDYLVDGVAPGHGLVEAWCRRRLPFGASGEMKAFQLELRSALGQLAAGEHELLHAVYVSPVQERVDAENVLFYNLESAASLRPSSGSGLRFERGYGDPPPPPDGAAGMLHYHRYHVAPVDDGFTEWEAGEVLGSVEAEVEVGSLSGLTRLWWELKTARWRLTAEAPPALFALRVRLEMPPRARVEPAVVVKPVIDAVVLSLQFHEHPATLDELTRRLAASLGASPAGVSAALTDQTSALLGGTRLAWPRLQSVQWNPADDRCVAGELRVGRRTGSRAGVAATHLLERGDDLILLVRHAGGRGSQMHLLNNHQAAVDILRAFGGNPAFLDTTPDPNPQPDPDATLPREQSAPPRLDPSIGPEKPSILG